MIGLLAALVAVVGCERKTPRGRAADPPPAPVAAAPPDAAIDAVAVLVDAAPAPEPKLKLKVRPGELPFLVALRGKLVEQSYSNESPGIAAVDLSDTASGDSSALAIAALDIAVRIQLASTAESAWLDSGAALSALAELRNPRDLDKLGPIFEALGADQARVNDPSQCQTEGCPEVPIMCLEVFNRASGGIGMVQETLGGLWGKPAETPEWIEVAEYLGVAISQVCPGPSRPNRPPRALTSQQVLEQLAARAR